MMLSSLEFFFEKILMYFSGMFSFALAHCSSNFQVSYKNVWSINEAKIKVTKRCFRKSHSTTQDL